MTQRGGELPGFRASCSRKIAGIVACLIKNEKYKGFCNTPEDVLNRWNSSKSIMMCSS